MPNVAKLSKFLKARDVKDGDVVNFMDAGKIETRDFKEDGVSREKSVLELTVVVNGDTKIYCPNGTSIDYLSDAWGGNTESWVGKQGRIIVLVAPNGKDMIICKPI